MELVDIIQGGGLVVSGVAFGRLLDAAMKAWSARNQRAEVRPEPKPAPFPVDVADKFVTCEQCRQHREHIEKRVDAQRELFSKVSDKLDLIEAHNEDRAKRMHDRLDPVIRSSASTAEVLRQHLEDHRAERSAKQ